MILATIDKTHDIDFVKDVSEHLNLVADKTERDLRMYVNGANIGWNSRNGEVAELQKQILKLKSGGHN